MRKLIKKKTTYQELDRIMGLLKDIRDDQEEIPCAEDGCICEQFDLILDEIESLRDKFAKE